ncbi:MAG: hypothetical protein EOP49_17625 [Sphingobacteriales bacterium]|nr:MAG: hypothetical protein EOP49_17625 [Sphingobacteriales bacterium]
MPTGTPINFSANIFNYDFTYTGVSTISANVSSVISFSFSGAVSTLLTVSIKKNGVVVYADSGTLNGAGAGGFTFPDTVITLVNGDVLNLNLDISPATPVPSFQVTYANLDVNAVGGRMVPALRNEAVPINSSIPKKVKQTDLLDSIIKMFNLHIVEDRDLEKVLVIRPFVQFYSATRRDWTSRVDRGQPYKITPLSELTCKRFNFKYDSDSDYYNEAYRNRNGGNYGDKVLPISYEFGENEKDVKLLFAGSPIVAGSGVVKPVTTIIKLNGSAEEPVASKLRILYGKIVSVPGHSWDIKDGATTLSTISNTYPYAGHLDDPFNPTLDLNFGPPREVFFTLNVPYPGNNLYTAYWEHFIKEIVNKDSHLLTCYVYLTPQDFYTVNFSEYVYIDGALYVLNKIIDFDTENRVPTKVEFLKVIKPLA